MRDLDWYGDAQEVRRYIEERLSMYVAGERTDPPEVECDRCGCTTGPPVFPFKLNKRTAFVLCPWCYRRRGHG